MRRIDLSVNHADGRGEIIDLIEGERVDAVTIVRFNKGAVRGNHVHDHTTQWNYLMSGRIRMVSRMPGEAAEEMVLEPGGLVVLDPTESHAFEALLDSDLMVFTRGPRGGKEYLSDTRRLDEPLITPPANR
jgi:mannose-6-phosphate isomerase-like protein (cupin superfamily)